MGSVWDDWVWYTGTVWEQYLSGGMASSIKRYIRKVPDDALSDIFFKFKLMARFQSHQGVRFHKKEDVIWDLEVPDAVLDLLFFFVEMDTSVRSNLRHQFESNPLVLRLLFSGWRR